MASVTNLRKGSTGDEVKKLQTALGFTGKDVDGIFGSKTEQAVINYQKANGLAVDGIAGKETQGSLYTPKPATSNTGGTQKTNTGTNTGTGNTFTTPAGNTYDTFTPEEVTYDPFQASDTLNQAWDTLGQLQGNVPGDFTDPYKDKHLSYLNQYENRDPFSYDFNSDALYQQYKDQYIMQGQLAMMDVMGQAAALSGGYGNSYAQTVGQQAYNQYLNQLNAMIPELSDRAYGIYQQEGQDLFNMYNAYKDLSDQEYNRYLGEVDNYYKQLDAATQYAQNLYNKEYGEWADKTGMDIDILNAKNNMGLDTWATKLGIISGENQMLMNQKFQATEAQKDRDFQETENAKSRSAAAVKSTTENTWNVGSVSVDEIIDRCAEYKKQGNNDDMEAYLDGLVASKSISQNYADELYERYRTDAGGGPVSDINVDPIAKPGETEQEQSWLIADDSWISDPYMFGVKRTTK